MNHPIIPIAVLGAPASARRGSQGRRVDPGAGRGAAPAGDASRASRPADRHLHKIQDHFGHLSAAHLAALAQEMQLAQTEVYEWRASTTTSTW
jgi:formate dehydrogenase